MTASPITDHAFADTQSLRDFGGANQIIGRVLRSHPQSVCTECDRSGLRMIMRRCMVALRMIVRTKSVAPAVR